MEREALTVAREEHRTKSELVREAIREYVASRRLRAIQQTLAAKARQRGIHTEEDIDRLIHELRSERRA
jgi:CopG family transcriptional regulator/antitoxin EndoAI